MRIYCGFVDTSQIGQTIDLYGWVDSLRELGHLQFILLRDRKIGTVPIILNTGEQMRKKIDEL